MKICFEMMLRELCRKQFKISIHVFWYTSIFFLQDGKCEHFKSYFILLIKTDFKTENVNTCTARFHILIFLLIIFYFNYLIFFIVPVFWLKWMNSLLYWDSWYIVLNFVRKNYSFLLKAADKCSLTTGIYWYS